MGNAQLDYDVGVTVGLAAYCLVLGILVFVLDRHDRVSLEAAATMKDWDNLKGGNTSTTKKRYWR